MESDLLDFEYYTVAWIAPLEIEAQAITKVDHFPRTPVLAISLDC